jgi:uncharacterized delta-60 repeat protein
VLTVVRYNTDGTLDPTFGGGTGTAISTFGDRGAVASALVQQVDGKLVAAGESTSGGQARFALVRYNADGTLDPTFGAGTGIVTTLVRGYTHANALVLQPDGKIVAAGYSDTLDHPALRREQTEVHPRTLQRRRDDRHNLRAPGLRDRHCAERRRAWPRAARRRETRGGGLQVLPQSEGVGRRALSRLTKPHAVRPA